MAQLIRDRDGEGYFGSRVEVVNVKAETITFWDGDTKSLIGNKLLVGTMTAGMFTTRDWWCTSIITDIISETEDEIRLETENSTYTFKK